MRLNKSQTGDTRPIRVLYILGRGVLGGIERHVQSILRNLDRTRFEPSVVILFEDGEVGEALRRDGFCVETLNGRNGKDPGLIFRLWRLIRRAGPDIVHSHELHACVGAAMRMAPRPAWILTEHCTFEFGPSPAKARTLVRLFRSRMDRVLAVSDATARSLTEGTGLPAASVATLYNGIDPGALPPKSSRTIRELLSLPAGARVLGTVGRLAGGKGFEDVLRVAELSAAERPDWHFVFVGGGPIEADLKQRAARLPDPGRVHFTGPRTDALDLIGGMDLFLFCSEHEAMPTTLLEAFAMRTPVAGFLPGGGVAEILALCDPPPADLSAVRDPAALVRSAGLLLDSPELAAGQVSRAREVVERHFDMRRITGRLQEIYEESLKGRRG